MEEYARELHRLYGDDIPGVNSWSLACSVVGEPAVIEAAQHGFVPTQGEADAYLAKHGDTLLELKCGWKISATARGWSVKLRRVDLRDRMLHAFDMNVVLVNRFSVQLLRKGNRLAMYVQCSGSSAVLSVIEAKPDVMVDDLLNWQPWLETLDWKAIT